jgi:hypothetical protein
MNARAALFLALVGGSPVFGSPAQNPTPQSDTLVASPAQQKLKPQSDTLAVPPPQQKVVPVDTTAGILWLIDDYPLTRARLSELHRTAGRFPILRSTSSLLWAGDSTRAPGVRGLLPQIQLMNNSQIPYSRNDGGLEGGRGMNVRLAGGVAAKVGMVRIIFAPELTTSQNDSFPPRAENLVPSPAIPPDRSKFAYPWYANGPYSLDMPLRFGDQSRSALRLGQSSIFADFGPVWFGFATENEWWGPGVDNALVMSNNAPGFPHLQLRSSHPLGTPVGEIEFRWMVGSLSQSDFFDTATTNNGRSISAGVVAIRPRWVSDLSLGFARSVVGTSTGWGEIPFRWLELFHDTGHPNDGAPYDSTLSPGGRDQIYSLFFRWVLPPSGAEIYGEWGRLDFPRNLRDLLVQPNRGQAYTLGLQWTRQAFRPDGLFQLRFENTSLEQSLALRNRFAGVWYTSRRVLQGFTNEGEVLGAAVGPGSSGQTLELAYHAPRGFVGFDFGRTRYNEDVHQASPMLYDYLRWCSHDVGLQWGFHGGFHGPLGMLSVRSLFQNRLNAYFQPGYGCPRSDHMVDLRNNNLTITFAPMLRR